MSYKKGIASQRFRTHEYLTLSSSDPSDLPHFVFLLFYHFIPGLCYPPAIIFEHLSHKLHPIFFLKHESLAIIDIYSQHSAQRTASPAHSRCGDFHSVSARLSRTQDSPHLAICSRVIPSIKTVDNPI